MTFAWMITLPLTQRLKTGPSSLFLFLKRVQERGGLLVARLNGGYTKA
jgi:hypothetical protein